MVFTAFGADSSLFAKMQARPSNRFGTAAQGPLYSVPAIGCVDTNCFRQGW